MKRILTVVLSLTMSMGQYLTPVCAKDAQMSKEQIYERELKSAVKSGEGTEDDPYVLNYDLAPNFEQFMIESWNIQNYGSNVKPDTDMIRSGFVGNCLTVYKGKPSAGAVWVYSSGGMSAASDGNLRIKKVAYNTIDQTHALAAAVNYSGFFGIINTVLNKYINNNKATIIAKLTAAITKAGITSIKGYSATAIATSIAKCAGAGTTIVGNVLLAKDILNGLLNVSLNNASKNNKTYVHIHYITAYHGEWYENSVGESGWYEDKVYTPKEVYGKGKYYRN